MSDEIETTTDTEGVALPPEAIAQGLSILGSIFSTIQDDKENRYTIAKGQQDLDNKKLDFEREKFQAQSHFTTKIFWVIAVALLGILAAGVILLFVKDTASDGLQIIVVVGSLLMGLVSGLFMKSPNQD